MFNFSDRIWKLNSKCFLKFTFENPISAQCATTTTSTRVSSTSSFSRRAMIGNRRLVARVSYDNDDDERGPIDRNRLLALCVVLINAHTHTHAHRHSTLAMTREENRRKNATSRLWRAMNWWKFSQYNERLNLLSCAAPFLRQPPDESSCGACPGFGGSFDLDVVVWDDDGIFFGVIFKLLPILRRSRPLPVRVSVSWVWFRKILPGMMDWGGAVSSSSFFFNLTKMDWTKLIWLHLLV